MNKPAATSRSAPEAPADEESLSSLEEARTRAILEGVSSGIVTLSEEGAIDSINPAALWLFGYSEPELLGQHVRLLVPALGRRGGAEAPVVGDRPAAGLCFEEGQSEVIGIRRDGTAFPLSLNLSRIQAGTQQLLLGVLEDLSAQRLLEQSILQASTHEQQRIGRDLHDGLGQELTGIAFLCQTLAQNLEQDQPDQAAAARRIVDLIGKAIEHTRAVVRGLCPIPPDADGLGLHRSLGELAASTETLFDVQCRYHSDPLVPVPSLTTATHVYYLASEAIHNALKHARARHLEIRLQAEEGWARLSIRDDGHRNASDRPYTGGRGMHIMESRVRMIRGLLNVVDGGEAGSLLSVSFPLPQALPADLDSTCLESEA